MVLHNNVSQLTSTMSTLSIYIVPSNALSCTKHPSGLLPYIGTGGIPIYWNTELILPKFPNFDPSSNGDRTSTLPKQVSLHKVKTLKHYLKLN